LCAGRISAGEQPVVKGLEGNPLFGQLLFHVLMGSATGLTRTACGESDCSLFRHRNLP
jgi:hypothetical protein